MYVWLDVHRIQRHLQIHTHTHTNIHIHTYIHTCVCNAIEREQLCTDDVRASMYSISETRGPSQLWSSHRLTVRYREVTLADDIHTRTSHPGVAKRCLSTSDTKSSDENVRVRLECVTEKERARAYGSLTKIIHLVICYFGSGKLFGNFRWNCA